MVKRSTEKNLRIKNFEARNGNYERNAVVKNQETKQRVQKNCMRLLAVEKPTGSVLKTTIAVSVTISMRAKSTQPNPSPSSSTRQNDGNANKTKSSRGRSPSGRMSRCKDYFKGICTNSFCEKWHPPECLFYKSKSGCRFWVSALMCTQVEEQPSKRSKKNGDKSAVDMLKRNELYDRTERPNCIRHIKYTTNGLRIAGYGAAEVFIDFAEELTHTETNPLCSIHQSRVT